jgi:ADP-dependent NAD(P)H-hydrate dehydratase / NAD(P)H-hydrate epimerase
MRPILTPNQMAAVDAADPRGVDRLVELAGAAIAATARRMLGGTYGRTVAVVAGPGNNGADGRVAARLLRVAGMRVDVFDALDCPEWMPAADLVIDAAFGTGASRGWNAPHVGDAMVLAVDLPSGVDAMTGAVLAGGSALAADRTITFGALKPGLLFGPGRDLAGIVELYDLGLDVGSVEGPATSLLDVDDVARWVPVRPANAHKWQAAVRVVAGSNAMPGAASLVAAAAQRTGAGMVHVSTPGATNAAHLPVEAVHRAVPSTGWADDVLRSLDRFHALVLGPGLGRSDDSAASARYVSLRTPLPVVLDGDALFALAWHSDGAASLLRQREARTVLTPHDGEYQLLTGAAPGADRIAAARRLASDSGCVVLLKGRTTVVADPEGDALVVMAGDQRLATAGTGDVLAGVIGALLAMGVDAFEAAAAGAWIHGDAAMRCEGVGFVASDLPAMIPASLRALGGDR